MGRTYWQLAESVLMGVPRAKLFPGKPARIRVVRAWSGPPGTPSPVLAYPPPTWPTHPHSSRISGIRKRSMCGQAEGAAKAGLGWQERRRRDPLLPHPTRLSPSSPLTRCSAGCAQRAPAHRSWNSESRNPMESTRLDPTWGARGTVSLEGTLATPRPLARCACSLPPGLMSPLPEHCPPHCSSGGSTAGAESSGRGGLWRSRRGSCSGGASRPGGRAPALVVLFGAYLKYGVLIGSLLQESFEGSLRSGKKWDAWRLVWRGKGSKNNPLLLGSVVHCLNAHSRCLLMEGLIPG